MRFYYLNSTHWDREWYMSFQEFRNYLCDTVIDLIDHLESGRLDKFIFDGQSIVLNDICEIHPSLRKRLESLVASGKLIAGPWYVMPDEFLVSPEALIRNLLAGHKIVSEFGGKAWKIGYICDIFGHIAQMPQILSGFGMRGAVVWRGFPQENVSRMLWCGADGTEIPVLRLPVRNGYGNFSLKVRGWWDIPLSKEEFRKRFLEWMEEAGKHFGDAIVMSDAVDHCQASGQVGEFLDWIREMYPDAAVSHSDLTDYFHNEFSSADTLCRVYGEQISPAIQKNHTGNQISATLSSRYDVKKANDIAQNSLELCWEPQLAERHAAGEAGMSVDKLDYLWRYLLQNHAHDSICGCAIDTVNRQVLSRMEEVLQLGRCLDEEFMLRDRCKLTGRNIFHSILRFEGDAPVMSRSDIAGNGRYTLRIYNPLPFEVSEVREFEICFPASSYPVTQAEPFGYENLNSFRIYEKGKEVPYSIKSLIRNQTRLFYRFDSRQYDVYTVAAKVTLPASGWGTLLIEPASDVVRYRNSMLDGQNCADNGIIRMDINPDGTIRVTDHRNGRVCDGINDFVLDRDIGDGWNHVSPVGGAVLTGMGNARIRLVHDGCDEVEFEITRSCKLPQQLVYLNDFGRHKGIAESGEEVTFSIVTRVAVTRGSEQLRMKLMLDNRHRDFRLRMVVPTGISGKYFVSQSGAILYRNPGREHGELSLNYLEPERIGKNFDGIIGKSDARGGVVLLSRCGVHEAGAYTDSREALVVTLMRAFNRTVLTDGEDDGELNKYLEWDFRLVFCAPQTSFAEMHRQLQILRSGFSSYLLPSELVVNDYSNMQSFCEITGDLSFSALKPAADGTAGCVVLRLLNLDDKKSSGKAVFSLPVKKAELCRLDESPVSELDISTGGINISAAPWEMVTVKVTFEITSKVNDLEQQG